MCNAERIENDVSGEPSTSQLSGIDIPASSIEVEGNTQPCDINYNNNTHQSINTGVDNESPQQFDNRKQPHAPTQEDQNDIKQNGKSKDGGGKKWDAFASLQSNFESSDDDDSAEDRSIKDKEEINDGRVRNNNNNAGWNAFASFEQNYESSDESESGSSSSDDDSEEEEESDGCRIEDDGHYGDLVDNEEDEMKKENSLKINSIVECVELLDSEDDEQNEQQEDDNSVCELDVKMPAGKDMTGKENNKSDKKRRRKRSPPKHPEAYTIDIGDSDSELSEVESRPIPSPELARQQRQLPSWQQRKRRSTPIQASSNGFNLKKASDYACMNGRNDLSGGSGTGVNGVRLAKKKGDDTTTTTGTKRKSGGRRKRRATSLPGLSMTTETTTSKPTTKRRRKTTASKTTSSKAKAPGAKRRRKRSYKKRSTKRRGGNTGGNAWAARERGVRGGQRRGNTGSAAPYMAIAKQEPLLANIGGASIQF